MRPYQVFAGMSPEAATAMMKTLSKENPAAFAQALGAACAALKARPVYLQKQPFDRRAGAIRRALSRVAASDVAEEILAVYFLDCRRELLVEWLDTVGVAHEDGTLADDVPAPPPRTALEKAVKAFREKDDDPERAILLRAFAAQSAIDWPDLEALL